HQDVIPADKVRVVTNACYSDSRIAEYGRIDLETDETVIMVSLLRYWMRHSGRALDIIDPRRLMYELGRHAFGRRVANRSVIVTATRNCPCINLGVRGYTLHTKSNPLSEFPGTNKAVA